VCAGFFFTDALDKLRLRPNPQAWRRFGRKKAKMTRRETFVAKAGVKLTPKRKKPDVSSL